MTFNATYTRAIQAQPFGVACYEGHRDHGEFKGTHQGVCRDWSDAERWLAGETPASLVRVYPVEEVAP